MIEPSFFFFNQLIVKIESALYKRKKFDSRKTATAVKGVLVLRYSDVNGGSCFLKN